MKGKIIEINHVSFAYDGKLVLQDASLDICAADFLGIVGPNGSGKSTLVKLILGILKPTAGRITVFGQAPEDTYQQRRIGYISQKATAFNQNFPASVSEVVAAQVSANLGLFRRLSKEHWEQIDSILDRLGLYPFRNTLVGRLSGGQQQKVFIARLLAGRPDVLVLDEPMVGMDVESQESLYDLMETLNMEGLTIIMVTHDITHAADRVSRLVCIYQQRIYEHSPSTLKSKAALDPYLQQVYHFH